MSFSIQFTEEVRVHDDEEYALGIIHIGSFEEYFEAALCFWSTNEYEQHWHVALQRVIDGEEVSCLVTEMHDPLSATYITTWPVYRIGDQVCFHNRLLFPEQLEKPFAIDRPWQYMDPRESVDEDGQKISEWFVPVSAVEDFLNSR